MRKRYPGKFEGCDDDRLAEVLYSITLESGCDEEIGSVDELGWYGLVIHRDHGYIVDEDSQGFFTYEFFDTAIAARKSFDCIIRAYDDEQEDVSNA